MDISMKIFDAKGSEIIQKEMKVSAGNSQFTIDISSYTKGIYMLKLQYESGSRIIKLVVM